MLAFASLLLVSSHKLEQEKEKSFYLEYSTKWIYNPFLKFNKCIGLYKVWTGFVWNGEFEIEEALKLHCKIRENQGMRSLFQVSRSVSETRKFKVW